MSNTGGTGDTPNENAPSVSLPAIPRESLIATAINFLQNPSVRYTPLQQKQKFLRSKGLTEDEIQIACERSGVFGVRGDPNSTVISMGINSYPPVHPGSTAGAYLVPHKQSTLARIKEILSSVALFGGIAYAIYLFYKKYIEPFLFGKKKKKSIEESLEEMDQKVDNQFKEINKEIIKVREEVIRSNTSDINRELQNFKSDLDAIKGLLLNRKQFAAPLPIVPPSIPAWQLTSQQHSEADKNDDAGSGSGSSETEVVTKNSDSSLEIM